MILVVDDEAAYREVLAKILTKVGYRVITSADGNEALTLLEHSHFDLVISDVFMPNLNGYALAARIRAKDPNVPIILISGYLSQDTAKNLLGDLTEYFAKPVDPESMIATVQRLMSSGGKKSDSGSHGEHAKTSPARAVSTGRAATNVSNDSERDGPVIFVSVHTGGGDCHPPTGYTGPRRP